MLLTNMFNMDETGFMLDQASSKRVVVPSGVPAAWFKARPGTRESVTFIKCIGSGSQILPLLIITKGCLHTVGELLGPQCLWLKLPMAHWARYTQRSPTALQSAMDGSTQQSAVAWHQLVFGGDCGPLLHLASCCMYYLVC